MSVLILQTILLGVFGAVAGTAVRFALMWAGLIDDDE